MKQLTLSAAVRLLTTCMSCTSTHSEHYGHLIYTVMLIFNLYFPLQQIII